MRRKSNKTQIAFLTNTSWAFLMSSPMMEMRTMMSLLTLLVALPVEIMAMMIKMYLFLFPSCSFDLFY